MRAVDPAAARIPQMGCFTEPCLPDFLQRAVYRSTDASSGRTLHDRVPLATVFYVDLCFETAEIHHVIEQDAEFVERVPHNGGGRNKAAAHAILLREY